MLRIVAVLVLLSGYLTPNTLLAQTQSKPLPPSQVAAQSLDSAKVESIQLTGNTQRMKFKHGGKTFTGDLTNTKVYMMKNGRKVEVPRAQWQQMLKAGTPITVITPKIKPGQSNLVVIAIIAILIGLLLPAVQKVRG